MFARPHLLFAFTQLKPDITIFSNSLRNVILIKLTCPCEKIWNPGIPKINIFFPLKSIIESNDWRLEIFAVEVGTRGYCSRSVLYCFKKLGFNNFLIRNTIKKLSKSSMECSFYIWLARNNKEQTPSAVNYKLSHSSKETCALPSSMWSLKRTINSVSNGKSIPYVDSIN